MTKKKQYTALVTGANRGIGVEICRQLSAAGLKVILSARNEEKGKQTVKKLLLEGHVVDFVKLDVVDFKSHYKIIESINEKYGRLDVLINNAAVNLDKDIPGTDIGLEQVRETLEVNLLGALHLTQMVVPYMRKLRYGRIVNVSSGMGAFSDLTSHYLAYRISKTSLNAITRILAAETMDENILINAVCPGWVRTDMGGSLAPRPTSRGAETIVWAATLPEGSPSGGFFRDKKLISW